MPKKRTQNKGMSIERWIFYEGLRMGNADTFQQYLALLPEKLTASVMPSSELEMFFREMRDLGGFMRVQSQKKWQQVVKNCNFPQTTSSSYSTRNKYESYLLPKEQYDLLMRVHRSQDERALAELGELCAYYFELLDAGTAKKNLLLPLQELFANSDEASACIVRFLEENPIENSSFMDALVITRCAMCARGIDRLSRALTSLPGVLEKLYTLATAAMRTGTNDSLIALVLLAVVSADLSEDTAPQGLGALLASACVTELPHPVLGHQFLTRMAVRAPPWVLCRLNAATLVQRVDFHVQARRVAVARPFARVAASTLRAYVATGQWPDENWEQVATLLIPITNDTDVMRGLAINCLVMLAQGRPELADMIHRSVTIPLHEVAEPEEDYDSDERPVVGFRRVSALGDPVTTSSVAMRLAKKQHREHSNLTGGVPPSFTTVDGGPPARSRIKRALDDASGWSGDDLDDEDMEDEGDDIPNEDPEARARRRKRVRERMRRMRLKAEHRIRAEIAAEKRESQSVLPPRRPRRPAGNSVGSGDEHDGGMDIVNGRRNADFKRRRRRNQGGDSQDDERSSSIRSRESMRLRLEVLQLENDLLDRDTVIASLASAVRILSGNNRFLSGALPSYTPQEAAIVRSHAEATLAAVPQPDSSTATEPRKCFICKEAPADSLSRPCFCFAYCHACVPAAGASCSVCGVKCSQ